MFKGTSVTRRNLLGKDGRSRCEVEGEYVRGREFLEKGRDEKYQKEKSNKKNIERR